jgi:hypothetical protein
MPAPVEIPAARGCDVGHRGRRCDLPPVWAINIHHRPSTRALIAAPGVAYLCAEHAGTAPDKWKPQ